MTHAAPSQKSCSEYYKVLSLVLCYLIFLFVVYFSLFKMSNIATYVEDDIPSGNYMLKINNRNTRTRCEICSKLTIKIMASFWCLCFLWTYFTPSSSVSIVNFETVNAGWEDVISSWLTSIEGTLMQIWKSTNIFVLT